jgi:hypothetical protein
MWPMQYCVVNGSPRGKRGNTEILLRKVAEGIDAAGTATVNWYYLNDVKTRETAHEVFTTSSVVLLGFPLYTDSMPGLVKSFIESWEPYVGRKGNPRLAFLVQSGFPEAHHSRFVERYLEKLARRMNAPYAGTIVKGGCEGLRYQPEGSNGELFADLYALGADLAQTGAFDSNRLRVLMKPEKYPRFLAPLFWLVLRLPFTQAYWDQQLKKNGVYAERFARPFKDQS